MSATTHILIVDHSRVIRAILREELEKEAYLVFEADSAARARQIAAQNRIDLVTLAVELPDGNGYQLCSELRNMQSERLLPVIIITGKDTEEERNKGFAAGALDFLTKPFTRDALIRTIERLIRPGDRFNGLTALIAEDSRMTRSLVTGCLRDEGVSVIEAVDGAEALELVRAHHDSLDLIITDLEMPNMRGDELCLKVRKELHLLDIPLIVISGINDQLSIIELFKYGASDYLIKPFIREELAARLHVHLETRQLHRKLAHKISELEDSNRKLERVASVDSLTGLPNRRYFFERFNEAISRRNRYGHPLAFLIVDIDFFKKVNDIYGHQGGDSIIYEFALLLKKTIRNVDIPGRIGGEEFGLLATETDLEGVKVLAEKLRKATEEFPFCQDKQDEPIRITISIGVYCSLKGDTKTVTEIYHAADRCLYLAKEEGRNRFCLEKNGEE